MLNWEMECKKWCPAFKILTYYGSIKERKAKRTGWTKPDAFHVCITSYKIAVQVCLQTNHGEVKEWRVWKTRGTELERENERRRREREQHWLW